MGSAYGEVCRTKVYHKAEQDSEIIRSVDDASKWVKVTISPTILTSGRTVMHDIA